MPERLLHGSDWPALDEADISKYSNQADGDRFQAYRKNQVTSANDRH
jgi:hypothetical protein